jgi:DNA-binding NarL/FixJ family response regulator
VKLDVGGETSDCGTVLIADGDAKERTRVSKLLADAGYTPVGAATGGEALAVASRERPLLAVVEVILPDLSGYEVCRVLKDVHGERLSVILFSGRRTEPYDRTVGLMIGADDYVVKPYDPGELLARVRRCVTRSAALAVSNGSPKAARYGMTLREHEVLSLLARGLGTAAIARDLVISEKTVATHIQRILLKLGVHSRAEVVSLAYRQGLVSEDAIAHLAAVD